MSEQHGSPAGDDAQRGLVQPSRRDRWRPLEMLGLSLVFALFAGIVTLFVMHPWGDFAGDAARSWLIILIAFGATFVVSVVTIAMFAVGGYEPPKEPPSNVLGDPH